MVGMYYTIDSFLSKVMQGARCMDMTSKGVKVLCDPHLNNQQKRCTIFDLRLTERFHELANTTNTPCPMYLCGMRDSL